MNMYILIQSWSWIDQRDDSCRDNLMNIPSAYCICITVSMFNIQWIFDFSKCMTYAWHLIVEATFHQKHSIEYTGNCNPFTSWRKMLYSYSLKRSTFPLEWWVYAERMLSTFWVNGEHTLKAIWWALMKGEQWVNTEHKRIANVSAKWMVERTVNDMWTLFERKMINLFGVPNCVSPVIKKK